MQPLLHAQINWFFKVYVCVRFFIWNQNVESWHFLQLSLTNSPRNNEYLMNIAEQAPTHQGFRQNRWVCLPCRKDLGHPEEANLMVLSAHFRCLLRKGVIWDAGSDSLPLSSGSSSYHFGGTRTLDTAGFRIGLPMTRQTLWIIGQQFDRWGQL